MELSFGVEKIKKQQGKSMVTESLLNQGHDSLQ